MAWTAPATFTVSEIVTASKLNTHVRDNLDYLKGNAGTIVLAAGLSITGSTTITGTYFAQGGTPGFWLDETGDKGAYFVLDAGQLQLQRRANGFGAFEAQPILFDIDAPSGSFLMNSLGYIGLGAATPSGRLHVTGAGEITGAGFCINSIAAVTSIRTIFATATVARAISLWIFDRNNTGGAVVSSTNLTVALSSSTSYVNSDTITVAVTAGGAVTVQRTSGTNGTHDIVILGLFL